jgi:hypothetical protein
MIPAARFFVTGKQVDETVVSSDPESPHHFAGIRVFFDPFSSMPAISILPFKNKRARFFLAPEAGISRDVDPPFLH